MKKNKVLIIDLTDKDISILKDEFVKPIENIIKQTSSFKTINIKDLSQNIINDFDKIILSGTALKDFKYLDYISKFDFLKTTKLPVLGICAGAQIIGLIYDSILDNCTEIGMQDLHLLKKNPLVEKEIKVYCLHKKKINFNENFELFAESKNCSQIAKVKNKQIWAVLFHPEVRNEFIIKNFLKL